MKFLSLFRVQVRHDYYGDTARRDLHFEPTTETRRLLERYRLLLKELPDGIAVWAPTGAGAKTTLISLRHGDVFVFHIIVRNPDFALCTDLQEFAGKTDPVYMNAETDGRTLELRDRESWRTETFVVPADTTKIRFTLAGNPLASDGDALKVPQPTDFRIEPPAGTAKTTITAYDASAKAVTIEPEANNQDVNVSVRYRAKPVRDRKILADVELRYDMSMSELGKDDAPFEIKFKARAGRWAYYLITDQPGDFSIGDSSKALTFSAANMNQVTDEDPLAAALSQRYPHFKSVRFLSDQPVPCSSAAPKGIELRLGGDKVLEAMPNPSVRHLSRIKQKVQAKLQDQDTFYQVVKHLKAP